eukprot:XP_001710052.1 Hypothetical protein GL50803_35011 [Giardia lamblia ATCC 50803]
MIQRRRGAPVHEMPVGPRAILGPKMSHEGLQALLQLAYSAQIQFAQEKPTWVCEIR